MVRRGSPVRVRKRALKTPARRASSFGCTRTIHQRAIGMEPFVEPSGREVSLPAAKNGHLPPGERFRPRHRRTGPPLCQAGGRGFKSRRSQAPRKIACLTSSFVVFGGTKDGAMETILETAAFAQSESDLPYAYVRAYP